MSPKIHVLNACLPRKENKEKGEEEEEEEEKVRGKEGKRGEGELKRGKEIPEVDAAAEKEATSESTPSLYHILIYQTYITSIPSLICDPSTSLLVKSSRVAFFPTMY
jgi:hypothetical protein